MRAVALPNPRAECRNWLWLCRRHAAKSGAAVGSGRTRPSLPASKKEW